MTVYYYKPKLPFKMMARHGGTALDAAEARGHGSCAEVLRKVGGRHSMQRTLAAKFRWRLMELCGVFLEGWEEGCRRWAVFFCVKRVFVLNVCFFCLAMRRVRVKDGFDDCLIVFFLFWTYRTWFYFGPTDEDKKEMSWSYTVLIIIVGLERVASSTKNRGNFHK